MKRPYLTSRINVPVGPKTYARLGKIHSKLFKSKLFAVKFSFLVSKTFRLFTVVQIDRGCNIFYSYFCCVMLMESKFAIVLCS